MKDLPRTNSALIEEISFLKQKIKELEQSESDHKLVKKALLKSEEKYRTLFEESFDGLFITSPGGKILDMNKKGIAMFGYNTKEEVLSLDLEKDVYANPSDRKWILALVNEQDTAEYEVLVKKKNGEMMITLCSLTAVKDKSGVITSYRGIIRDITECKQTEEVLLEINERLSMALEMSNAGIWEWYLKSDEVRLDDWFHEMLGYTPGELPNTLPEWLPYHHPDDIPIWMPKAEAYLRGDSPIYESTHRIRNKAGTWSWVFTRGKIVNHTPVRSPEQFIGIAINVTEQKQAEEERKAHIRFLENLARIDQAIKQETDVEQMLWNIIKMVFSIFDCDRAWLVYPCDPDAPSFRVPVEITKPEYPGAKVLNVDVPMSPGEARNMREALESDEPVTYIAGTERPIMTAGQFGVQSQMFIPIYPKLSKPWVFGIHQCSHPRIWTKEEQNLFKEISRRISDGLSSVIFLREMQESEERYRNVFENHTAVKFLIDPDTGSIIEANEAAVNYYGWSHEQLKQMKIQEINILPPEDVKKVMKEAYTRKQTHFEFRHRRADGSIRDVEVFSSNIKVKGKDILHSIIHDITDRKQTEEKLKVSEDKYRTIFENAVEGIFQTTPEGLYISVNPALAKMKGYDTPEELMKEVIDISKQTYVNPEDRVRYKEILEEKGIIQGFETRHYRKDGSIICVSINARAVRDTTGKVLHYEGTIEDITARKTADEEFKKNTEKLRKSLSGTIRAISMIVEARDPYTSGHQRKVSDLACAIAQGMALPDDTIDNIRMAGIIHDIGKISIPAEILSKPGKLTDIEFSLIKVHSQAGYDILKDIELPYPIAEIILQHHERLDGSGYPQGLKDDRIFLESRIIAVADIVEAMASHRPYRPAHGIDAALEEIEKNKSILYDEKVVEVCLKLFREKGFQFEGN